MYERPKRDLSAEEILEYYQPKLIGAGSNQLVYALPNHPTLVAKVSVNSLTRMGVRLAVKGLKEPDGAFLRAAAEHIGKEFRRREALTRYFPTRSILHERTFFTRVPVPSDLKHPESVKGAQFKWGILRIQDRLPQDSADERSLDVGHAERRRTGAVDEEVYWRVTEKTVNGEACDIHELISLHHALRPWIEEIQQDEALRAELTTCVASSIAYANGEQESLDLAGAKNILFQKDPTGVQWRFFLVDAFMEFSGAVALAKQGIHNRLSKNPLPLSVDEVSACRNTINFVRGLNGLAAHLGIPDRIQYLSELSKLSPDGKKGLLHAMKQKPM